MVPDTDPTENSIHHEEQRSFQVSFHTDVKSLVTAMEKMGNPFLEETSDLFALDSKVIAEEATVLMMRQIESTGREQCKTFIAERLMERKKPLTDPIKRNKLSFFTTYSQKTATKAVQQLSSMKRDTRDVRLLCQIKVTCGSQRRSQSWRNVFKHLLPCEVRSRQMST